MDELAHSIGVLVYDGEDNVVEFLLKKGTRLPASATADFSLLLKFKSIAKLKILEGESVYIPQGNRVLGELSIFRKIAMSSGDSVKIKLEADEKKMLHVTCWHKRVQILSKSIAYGFSKNYGYEMAKASIMLKEAKYTLRLLESKGTDVGSYGSTCGELEADYHKYMTNGDLEAMTSYLSRFHQFYLEVMFLERLYRLPISYAEKISKIAIHMKQYGAEKENAKFRFLETILGTGGREDRDRSFKEILSLYDSLVNSNFALLQERFLDYENELLIFTNDQKAIYWKSKAHRAIEAHDQEVLKSSINKLEQMRVKSINDAVNVLYADFRKIEEREI